ncbi:MAG: hypothetical protein ACPLW9_01425 [Minisyncoccales bacterium]
MGKNSQINKIINPIKKIKISIDIPKIIKKVLIIAPTQRESKLENRVSKYTLGSNLLL